MEESRVRDSFRRVRDGGVLIMQPAAMLLCGVLLAAPLTTAAAAEKVVPLPPKQAELKQIRLKKPVKIKLKRNARDDYSWELSGDDPDEVVRVDHRLRKLLNVQ